ncbi:MAG TPA: efflux transporter outer membrane subunit [Steroidobacteraceae bacterium]|jgi:NodT family efflux transporter outer membrane factor (OMF) lipoprotein
MMRARTARHVPAALSRSPLPLCIAFALSGCVLKAPPSAEDLTKEVAPSTPLPSEWTAAGAKAGEVQNSWLATFDDPQLNDLVAEAIKQNADLRAAAARVEQAEAYVKVAGGQLYPTVDALGKAGGKMSGDSSGLEGVLVSASWELDLWGRVRYGTRSAKEQYASAAADFAFAQQSLAALVAKSWFLLTEASLQHEILTEMVESATRLTDLAGDRYRIGIGSELDVASARVNLQTYRDSLRQVDLAREQAMRSLEVLVGRYPAARIGTTTQLDNFPPDVPAGLPSELLERRPDVIAAQQRVAAAFSRYREAQAARLPKIALTASGSHLTSDFFVLQDRDNPVWSIGGSVFAPLFRGGALKAQAEVRSAEQKQAVAQYVTTALKAFGDVENALSSEVALQERETILASAVADGGQALRLSEIRYRVGSGDLRAVQQQQLAYYTTKMTLLRVQTERRVQRVNLHLALGGDFAAGV